MNTSRIDAGGRIQRLLAILRHANGDPAGVPYDELAARFGLTTGQLVKELELASMVGAESANFHDMPFEVLLEDDRVFVRLFSLDQPLRLTPEEGLALVAAADALAVDDPDDSPLRRGLEKVAKVLGLDPAEAIDVHLDPLGGPSGQLLDEAIRAGRRVRFRYWTYGRDEVAQRTVDPWRVFDAAGAWYLAGRDVEQDGARRFRLDRLADLVVLDEAADPPPPNVDRSVEVDGDAPRVTIDLPSEARWVAEYVPTLEVAEAPGGRLHVTLAVAGRSWLERLLLRVGPDARIVEIDDRLGDERVLEQAAARILARYRGSGAAGPR